MRARTALLTRAGGAQVVHVQLFGATPGSGGAGGARPPINFDVNESATVGATLDIAIERATALTAAAAAAAAAVTSVAAATADAGAAAAAAAVAASDTAFSGVIGVPRECLRLRRYDPVLALRYDPVCT